jgi:hypothetical protein
MKQVSTKTAIGVLGLNLIIFLSAFAPAPEKHLTRIGLSQLIGEIIVAAIPDHDFSVTEVSFTDLVAEQINKVFTTSSTGIMKGFPDKTFRPDQKVTNREFLWYLYRAFDFLRLNAPKALTTKRLAKIVGYNRRDFFYHIESSFSIFFDKTRVDAFVSLHDSERFRRQIFADPDHINTRLLIIDAFTKKPIFPAYAVISNNTVVSDRNGKARIEFTPDPPGDYEIFISAPGYRNLTLKRSFLQKNDLKIRLKPITTNLTIRVIDNQKKKPVQKFFTTLTDQKIEFNYNENSIIKNLSEGYHDLKIEAEGFKPVIKSIYAKEPNQFLQVFMEPI